MAMFLDHGTCIPEEMMNWLGDTGCGGCRPVETTVGDEADAHNVDNNDFTYPG